MDDQRYHLTLSVDGQPAMHGWWSDRGTAGRKLRTWIGERGSMPGTRFTLVDEETGKTLTTWPNPS
jgi:hypothetical protein